MRCCWARRTPTIQGSNHGVAGTAALCLVSTCYKTRFVAVAPLAAAAGVPLLEQFEGTWAGSQAGLLRHHDSTRIHFSDTGRVFLAQLTLNLLPLVLPYVLPRRELPPPRRAGELRLSDFLSHVAP